MNRKVVIWSDQAWKDLDGIYDFIAKDSVVQAEKQVFRIIDRTEQLFHQPTSGPIEERVDAALNARYLVQDNYKIIYTVEEDRVIVDTVFDTRQDPDKLKL